MAAIINHKVNQNNFFCVVSLNHLVDRTRPKADLYPISRLLFEIHDFDIVI